MTFKDVLAQYDRATARGRAGSYEAAISLPQSAERQVYVAQADGIVRGDYAVRQWRASVADAAAKLRMLCTIHDNGGSGSTPKRIKDAARELLRLIGED